MGDVFHIDKVLFRDFLTYAAPVIINELLWGLGSSTNTAIIGHMGSAAVAANSVATMARQLALVVGFHPVSDGVPSWHPVNLLCRDYGSRHVPHVVEPLGVGSIRHVLVRRVSVKCRKTSLNVRDWVRPCLVYRVVVEEHRPAIPRLVVVVVSAECDGHSVRVEFQSPVRVGVAHAR